jgi:hypothetical protein
MDRRRRLASRDQEPEGGMVKGLLLFAPCLIAAWAPLYNFAAPPLFGIPFFYWFQLALIPTSAVCIYIADRVGKA